VDVMDSLYPGWSFYLEDKKMTATTLILIVVISLVCSIIAIYFYDRKLMREISKYEKKMYKKNK
jgi:Na+-transporting NADH:ubiquinone oxidoreductase subunit NqrC